MRVLTVMVVTVMLVAGMAQAAPTFGEDAAFLKKHADGFVLGRGDGQIVVVPEYQARVMTSTTSGAAGVSIGWVNHELIASGEITPHIYPVGGEERFWLGPEGSKFAIFFAPGTSFNLDDWQTPAPIDTEPFLLVRKGIDEAVMARQFSITNRAGFTFDIDVERTVRVLSASEALGKLGVAADSELSTVAYETVNELRNAGDTAWKKETGLISIWLLGMFQAAPNTNVAIPIKSGSDADLGIQCTDDYFGKVPSERLKIKDDVIYFKADGHARNKIGVSPQRSKGMAASYDPDAGLLNFLVYGQSEEYIGYVNNLWEDDVDPYVGDSIMSYNDDGSLGGFYEIESTSPAIALAPGNGYTYAQTTIHIQGPKAKLDAIAKAVLGVSLDTIQKALP